jgi:hypothetical protein
MKSSNVVMSKYDVSVHNKIWAEKELRKYQKRIDF